MSLNFLLLITSWTNYLPGDLDIIFIFPKYFFTIFLYMLYIACIFFLVYIKFSVPCRVSNLSFADRKLASVLTS